MNILKNVIQGSEIWLGIRANHFTASEASAASGLSKYLDRNELLDQKATGKIPDVDQAKQKIFDSGHDAEQSAISIAEEIIDDELFAVTATLEVEGLKLLASYDGVTLDHSIIWEHKLWSEDLAKQVYKQSLDPHYSIQLDQQLLISGAEKCLFMTSDGTKENCAWMWYETTESKKAALISSWQQFQKDLAEYQPRELAEKPEPAAIMQLPALSIQIKGEVIVSNLPQFKAAAETFIAEINTDLQTDEDFVNAEATVKFCDETEKKLESAKAAAIGQTASIDELMRTIDFIKESIRSKRLTLEKLVKTQKETIKNKIVEDGFFLCEKHADSIHDEFKQIHFLQICTNNILSKKNLEAACKNKRTLASLHNAVDTEVAAIKIKLDELAGIVRRNLRHLPEDLSLFRDLQSIITKPEDDFKLLVESRLSEQKRKEEEVAKRVAEELKAAEERGRAQAEAAAERERIARENEEKLAIEAKESEARKLEQEAKAKESMEAHRAEVQKREEDRTKADERHRINILETVCQSFKDAGFNHQESERIVTAIKSGDIPHVTINF